MKDNKTTTQTQTQAKQETKPTPKWGVPCGTKCVYLWPGWKK